jgi:Domain of unknown function (DUF5655)
MLKRRASPTIDRTNPAAEFTCDSGEIDAGAIGTARCLPDFRRAVSAYNDGMLGHECYHCKQWVAEGEPHDCWTTTEAALTEDLDEDLRDAWERLRETAASFGEQRIYASHKSIMFSRRSCYFFVRPKTKFLELCIFLGRPVRGPQVRRVERTSATKLAHMIQIRHRDEVESPITDWLQEAYALSDRPPAPRRALKQRVRSNRRTTTRALKNAKRR